MEFNRLNKLSLPNVGEPEDLWDSSTAPCLPLLSALLRDVMILSFEIRLKCGSMEFYNKTYDRVTTKSEKKLERINRIFHKVTTTDDPIIRRVTTHPPLTSALFSQHSEWLCFFCSSLKRKAMCLQRTPFSPRSCAVVARPTRGTLLFKKSAKRSFLISERILSSVR